MLAAGGDVAVFFDSLTPGQTGCLRGGDYGGLSAWYGLTASGTSSAPITLRSYPGETATIHGAVEIDGAYTTLSYLRIDGSNNRYSGSLCSPPGRNLTAVIIKGQHAIFEHNEVTDLDRSYMGNAMFVGGAGQDSGDNSIIRYNRIHDYGSCYKYDHAIYLGDGVGVQVYGNWIWNGQHGNAIQAYPNTDYAKVYANVIDTAGMGFSIADNGSATATNNEVYHNVVIRSTGMYQPPELGGAFMCGQAIMDYGPVAGTNNSFHDNASWQNPCGIGSPANVLMYGNITTDPLFVNAAAHDYRLQPGSPLAAWALWDGT
jgi:hypothetical protein